ncbi:MAG TPA: mechanosensitive ion channel family protein [Burkholderiales bacterium]|jgi:small conductance mechanosensitive channel|nr:mechanosensitive ion channel family protein [Burkholderiales bacterium]
MDEQLQSLDQITTTAIDLAVKFAPKALVAVLILAAGFYAGRWAGRGLTRALARVQLEPPVRALLARVTEVMVLGLFAIMALQNLGVELLPLIAGLGIAGAGVALAMQGVLGNIVAGLTIMITRPFKVGDFISVAGEQGAVEDISLFSTTLGHADQSKVVIPNRKIVGEILHNYHAVRQLGIEVGVSYKTDIVTAVQTIREILRANPRVLKDPDPVVGIARLRDSCVVLAVAPWVQAGDYGPAGAEINQAILEAFRARDIVIPAPQREVRVLSTTAYLGDSAKERFANRDAA